MQDVWVRKDNTRAFAFVEQNDVFEDLPWALMYKELDQQFPNSRFVLLTRKDAETWVASLKRHTIDSRPLRRSHKLAFGHYYAHGREQDHLAFYERHNKEVRDYLRNRPQDLLELCWEHGEGWEKLCAFLEMGVPDAPFPHKGLSKARKNRPFRKAFNRLLSATGI